MKKPRPHFFCFYDRLFRKIFEVSSHRVDLFESKRSTQRILAQQNYVAVAQANETLLLKVTKLLVHTLARG